MAPLKSIVVQTWGTRGDVQPFIAIGLALKAAGYDVQVLTNVNHVSLILDSKLEGVGVFLDTEKAFTEDPVMVKALADGDYISTQNAATFINKKHAESQVTEWFKAMESIKPDLVISGTQCQLFGALAERMMDIPMIPAILQCVPESPRRMIFGLPNLPCCCNRWMTSVFAKGIAYPTFGEIWDPPIFKLKGYKVFDVYKYEDFRREMFDPVFGTLVGMSKMVAKEICLDPSPNLKFCGPFLLPAQGATDKQKSGIFGSVDTTEAVKAFLEAGSKPAYLGWGSMSAKSPEYMVELVARAVKLAGARGIVFQGYAKMSMDTLRRATKDQAVLEYAEKNLLFVGKTPHDWLFPQCSCIVHHGGSGTMATAALSGSPQIITPLIIDQWDHAYFLDQYGAGVGFWKTSLTKLTAQQLSEAIKTCESSEKLKKKSADWGEIAKAEKGCAAVVEHVEWLWSSKVETGEYKKVLAERLAEIKRTGQ